ncbi:universal stress protein [Streptomyces sp. NBC_00249]|uniref:universal stress protein n=1 Tax=Streptomyces sp. NBC_00249 TaxID=2975690 RepID=UPI00225B594C|nr:universal stress protein [Streptomyces sp. NBC_00249]MCX5195478.1 universal stress protein [Streptomyces sp. NBC_00249]
MRRVVVGVSGTPGSLAALHRAAVEARTRSAELWVVMAWQAPRAPTARRCPREDPVLAACRAAAVQRLREVLDTAFGAGPPPGVTLAGLAVRATPGAALVDTADGREDLLVVGTGSRSALRRLRPSVARHCLAHAACPVLTVPPSPLEAELDAARRRNLWRLPLDARELTP